MAGLEEPGEQVMKKAAVFLFCVACVACSDDTEYPRYSCAIPAESVNDAGTDAGSEGCELLN